MGYNNSNGGSKKFEMSDYQFIGDHNIIADRGQQGWHLELNVVKWRPEDTENKFDIRVWSPDHKKMGKGISMSKPEISSLKAILNTMDDL